MPGYSAQELVPGYHPMSWPVDARGGAADSTIVRCLDLLSAVCMRGEALTVKEVTEATGINRATTYRMLEQLLEAGWLTADGWPRRFRASIRVAQLGLWSLQQNAARTVTLSHAINCARTMGKRCAVNLYHDGYAVLTDTVVVLGERVSVLPWGAQHPAAGTASGKILLAYQSDEEIARIAARGLPPMTSYTRTDPAAIVEDIMTCRRRGYAIDDREREEFSVAVGVPVFDASGAVVAAMAVGLGEAPTAELIQQAADTMLVFSQTASTELGYTGHHFLHGAW